MFYTFQHLGNAGRLGNQLFQIAAVVAAARQDGVKVALKQNWPYRPFFSVPDEFFGNYGKRVAKKDFGYKYYQEWPLWNWMEDDVRAMFQMNPKHNDHFSTITPVALIDDSVATCAVHMRYGDYDHHRDLFPHPSKEFYYNAFDLVQGFTEKDIVFLVFSDNINKSRRYLQRLNTGMNFQYIKGITTPVEVRQRRGTPQDQWDMFLIAECDYHIVSNSTFSWWGAFLSDNREPIYPKNWWTSLVPEYPDMWKLFPDTWIGLDS